MGYRQKWSDGDWEFWDDEVGADVREDICLDVITSGKPYDFGSAFPFAKRDYEVAKEYRDIFVECWPDLKTASYHDLKILPDSQKQEIFEWFWSNWYQTEEWDDEYDDGETYDSGIPFDIGLSDFVDVGSCHGPAYKRYA